MYAVYSWKSNNIKISLLHDFFFYWGYKMQQTIFFAEIQNKMVLSKKDELGKHDAYIYIEEYTHV